MGFLSFLDPIGLFGGGGSSSSSSVSSTVNLNVNGLDDMKSTIEVKPLEVKPLTINSNVDLKPVELKPVTLNSNIDLKPVTVTQHSDSSIELKPVEVKETFDLRPVAVDTCQTVRLAPLPDTRVCQPYRHHVAYTLFGTEWSGVTYEGESQQVIESPKRPQVVDRMPSLRPRRTVVPATVVQSRGIRVRVLDPDE